MLLAGLMMLGLAYLAEATPPAGSVGEGETIFQEKCVACHTIGGGDLVGPDLKNVTVKRDRDWLERFIYEPDKMLAEGDLLATQLLKQYNDIPMPSLELSEDQVASILAYLETQSDVELEVPAEEPEEGVAEVELEKPEAPEERMELMVGDPLTGKSLFTGAIRFQNRGPPCMACHNIGGISALGGGLLGPDLTETFSKFGDAGVSSLLETLPFPTMKPIYDDRPLTPEEQTHLKAFLQTVVERQLTQDTAEFGLLAVVGLAVAILLVQVVWWRRLWAVRRPMVREASKREVE